MEKAVCVIDKTGRGHSICDALIRTDDALTVYYIPGTGGRFDPRIIPVPQIGIDEAYRIIAFCRARAIELVVVSHIDALVAGLADRLRDAGFAVIGASAAATQLESSKWFCKKLCADFGVSTPHAIFVGSQEEMSRYLESNSNKSFMIKADWLTSNGNGSIHVKPPFSAPDILRQLDALIRQNPRQPYTFIVEHYLDGFDYSAHYVLNPSSVVRLPSCQDFKKSHDNDAGCNCDGMGSISPHPQDSRDLAERIRNQILDPVLTGLRRYAIDYIGPIYLGIRVDGAGQPHLLEINTRCGDSESQVIFPRIQENLYNLFLSIARGDAVDRTLCCADAHFLTISLVTARLNVSGRRVRVDKDDWPYTNSGPDSEIIVKPEELHPAATIYWANTVTDRDRKIKIKPGRVAHLVAAGPTLTEARRRAYSSLNAISCDHVRWRSDI